MPAFPLKEAARAMPLLRFLFFRLGQLALRYYQVQSGRARILNDISVVFVKALRARGWLNFQYPEGDLDCLVLSYRVFEQYLPDQLEKRGVFSVEQADAERRHAWRQLIQRKSADARELAATWKRVPDRYSRDTAVAGAAATAFLGLGQHAEAAVVIERSLDLEWDSGLVHLYGECGSTDSLRQIEHAERWLKAHRTDAALLLALGRLCALQQLWGKAQSYLEASVALEPTYAAHLELAQLHERLERSDAARAHHHASLELAVAQLNRSGTGRRRKPV